MGAETVFISYSHDSTEHSARVLELANALLSMGVDVELDQFEVRPKQGWPRWCEEQLRPENAKYVLVICTPNYRNRVENRVAADEGRGVFWEGGVIYQYLYDDKGNTRFIPVLLGGASEDGVPLSLKGHARYRLEAFDLSDPEFEGLYRELTGQPSVVKRIPGAKVVLPPRETPRRIVAAPLPPRAAQTDFSAAAAAPADISAFDHSAPAELIGRKAELKPIDKARAKAFGGAPVVLAKWLPTLTGVLLLVASFLVTLKIGEFGKASDNNSTFLWKNLFDFSPHWQVTRTEEKSKTLTDDSEFVFPQLRFSKGGVTQVGDQRYVEPVEGICVPIVQNAWKLHNGVTVLESDPLIQQGWTAPFWIGEPEPPDWNKADAIARDMLNWTPGFANNNRCPHGAHCKLTPEEIKAHSQPVTVSVGDCSRMRIVEKNLSEGSIWVKGHSDHVTVHIPPPFKRRGLRGLWAG